jgi:hypothetical protein
VSCLSISVMGCWGPAERHVHCRCWSEDPVNGCQIGTQYPIVRVEFAEQVLQKYIYGGHVSEYMESMQEEEPEQYEKQFSRMGKEGLEPDELEDLYKKVRLQSWAASTSSRLFWSGPVRSFCRSGCQPVSPSRLVSSVCLATSRPAASSVCPSAPACPPDRCFLEQLGGANRLRRPGSVGLSVCLSRTG